MVIAALHSLLGLSLYQVCVLAPSTHSLSRISLTTQKALNRSLTVTPASPSMVHPNPLHIFSP